MRWLISMRKHAQTWHRARAGRTDGMWPLSFLLLYHLLARRPRLCPQTCPNVDREYIDVAMDNSDFSKAKDWKSAFAKGITHFRAHLYEEALARFSEVRVNHPVAQFILLSLL